MKVFVDTSTLFKKYLDEPGSAAFDALLAKTTEIAVSPVTWIEINAALERCVRYKSLSSAQAERLRTEAKKDFAYFWQVVWNENLEEKAVDIIRKHALKTLDAVQLASGVLSQSALFVTSDQKLFEEAKKILPHTEFI